VKQTIPILAGLILSSISAMALTNQVPIYVPRPAEVPLIVPQPQPALQPADPYAPPPVNSNPTPRRPQVFKNPPTARAIMSNALRPAPAAVNLPPVPSVPAGFTNDYYTTAPAAPGKPVTNAPPRPFTPIRTP